jgi:hypothetical protein
MQTVRASSHAYISIKGGYNLEPELLCKWKQAQVSGVPPRSDGTGEFGEDCCELMPLGDIHADFVVAAMEVLDERVHGTNHLCRAESFQDAYGP